MVADAACSGSRPISTSQPWLPSKYGCTSVTSVVAPVVGVPMTIPCEVAGLWMLPHDSEVSWSKSTPKAFSTTTPGPVDAVVVNCATWTVVASTPAAVAPIQSPVPAWRARRCERRACIVPRIRNA